MIEKMFEKKENIKVKYLFIFLGAIIIMTSFASSSIFDWFKSPTGRATTQSVTVNISVGNNAPNITVVSPIAAVDLTEDSSFGVQFNFTAYDADGATNLDDATARLNVSRTGESVRQNTSCVESSTYGTYYANYTCTVRVWYFDAAGVWNVTASINDTSASMAQNYTTTFTINQLSAFTSGPGALTFPALNPGSTNTTSNNDPLELNNTGNKPITAGNVNLNATNLVGETDNSKALYAGNFSVGNQTGGNMECDSVNSTLLVRAVNTSLVGAFLPRGNHTADDGTTGQELLYTCLRIAGTELSSQAYSTTAQGAWTLQIN